MEDLRINMRIKSRKIKRWCLLLGAALFWWLTAGCMKVQAQDTLQETLLGEMDFTQVQEMVDDMLQESSFSFLDAVKRLMTGEELISKEAVQELLRGLFFSRFLQEKDTFLRILLLVLAAAVFADFARIFEDGQIAEVSFYVVYLVLFVLLMDAFSQLCSSLSEKISWMAQFMKLLSPAYFLAVAASTGTTAAAVFYQGILLLVWAVQWGLLTVILPGVNIYVLLCLVNHLSKEEMLGKMAELLKTAVSWGLRTLIGLVAGLQIVRNLVAPVMDTLKRTALGKTASALPGVGNAVNVVTELVLTSAVLVRNSIGVAALLALTLAGLSPVIHYGMLSFAYRFLAAVAQPVSDKRMVGCLSTMGEGCAMLLRILLTMELLCILTLVILMVSFGSSS
jgi:stage III sporulation protein AE